MYIWNGFAILGKRADLTENMLVTIEKAETELQKNPSEYNLIHTKSMHPGFQTTRIADVPQNSCVEN